MVLPIENEMQDKAFTALPRQPMSCTPVNLSCTDLPMLLLSLCVNSLVVVDGALTGSASRGDARLHVGDRVHDRRHRHTGLSELRPGSGGAGHRMHF